MRSIGIFLALSAILPTLLSSTPGCPGDDLDHDGWTSAEGDCDDSNPSVNPDEEEVCNDIDDNCDGATDDVDQDGDGEISSACGGSDCQDTNPAATECTLENGGHRVDRHGIYLFTNNVSQGFGIVGTSLWYGANDPGAYGITTTFDEQHYYLYYSDSIGYVYRQTQPFSEHSDLVGIFSESQLTGAGVVSNGRYYIVDAISGDIWNMDVESGETSVYSQLGNPDCKPVSGVSSIALHADGRIFVTSGCGVLAYAPGGVSSVFFSHPSLAAGLALSTSGSLYVRDKTSTTLIELDSTSAEVKGSITFGTYGGGYTSTLAIDQAGNFVTADNLSILIYSSTTGELLNEYYLPDWYTQSPYFNPSF